MASFIKKINEYNTGISPELKELKWKALKESPFRFYRGTCHLFAEDFAKLYRHKPKVRSWICGDLHFENFGSYKGESRIVYFDLNDFDEAILASPETEVARFLTSVIIGADQMNAGAIGLHKLLHDIMEAYTTTLQKGKALMLEQEVAHGSFKKYFEHLNTFDRQAFIAKRTYKQKGALLLKIDNVHFMALDDVTKSKLYHGLTPLLESGRLEHMVFEDAAFRIAGTGSLGVERYCVLCYSKKKGKHYLIDVKEARKSSYTGLVNIKQPRFKNEADRVNRAGYMMQFNSPAFATTIKMEEQWYVVRELQLMADRMSIEEFGNDLGTFSAVTKEMGVLMAYAHLRSSGHLGASTADALMAFAEKKQWQKDIMEVSVALAKKNAKYYREFVKA
jgi:uncharacterized protein (DUF2252 family)